MLSAAEVTSKRSKLAADRIVSLHSIPESVFDAAVGLHAPRLRGVEVNHAVGGVAEIIRFNAPQRGELLERRLALALVVRATRNQNRFLAAPLPWEAEARVRFREYRLLE